MNKISSILLTLSIFAVSLFADRVLTDQIGREITLPDEVKRIVVLQHQSLNVLNQINAMDKVVGVLQNWEKQLGKDYLRLAPSLKDMPTPGDLKAINYESVMELKPDVVIVTNYIPEEYIKKMEELKIPVAALTFSKREKAESTKLNPTLTDETTSYTEGLYEGIELLGKISNREKEAAELIDYVKNSQKELQTKMQNLKIEKRTKIYMANPDLTTYGSGKYTAVFLKEPADLT